MKVRIASIIVAAAAACGLVSGGVGDASAAKVVNRGDTTYIAFTNDETIKIAGFGVESLLDRPDVRRYWSAGPDPKTRDKIFFVPGRGLIVRTSAERMVQEAASKPGGQVIVGIHPGQDTILTLYTVW